MCLKIFHQAIRVPYETNDVWKFIKAWPIKYNIVFFLFAQKLYFRFSCDQQSVIDFHLSDLKVRYQKVQQDVFYEQRSMLIVKPYILYVALHSQYADLGNVEYVVQTFRPRLAFNRPNYLFASYYSLFACNGYWNTTIIKTT